MRTAEARGYTTLYDVDPYTTQQVAELCDSLTEKLKLRGWNHMPVDEQVELRLLITLLDGFATEGGK